MARQKTLYSLLDVKKKTGISYPTLIKYARDYAEKIPAVGQGRNRRYTVESIKVFERLYKQSRPGRRPGADWVKYPADAEASLPGQGGGETVQLTEEDRDLLRNVLEALRDVAGKLQALSESAQRIQP
ncbi:MAG TPA: hypothetical protein VGG03_19410 [Thermoanaerobaculia bacterium]|jgi:hypothetical protein